jgi:hypothetical protein
MVGDDLEGIARICRIAGRAIVKANGDGALQDCRVGTVETDDIGDGDGIFRGQCVQLIGGGERMDDAGDVEL